MSSDFADFLDRFGIKTSEMMHRDGLNTAACIVAVPRNLDPVRLIGDENKHATLLYFGETSKLPEDAKGKLIQILTLASRMFEPFSENIVSLDRLGSDNPPALVLKLSGRRLPKVREVLTVVPEVNEYLGNATQYPSYTPHVTLEYPDFPREAELREQAKFLHSVRFDRLALWWNDERYEFDLRDSGEVGESDDAYHGALAGDFLAHFGVKGMRWGVRRDRTNVSTNSGISAKKAPAGTFGSAVKDGKTVLVQKQRDGSWRETYLSADEIAYRKAVVKPLHELNTREIQMIGDRRRQIQNYTDLLAPKAVAQKSELQQKIDRLQMEKQLRDLQIAMTPAKKHRVRNFFDKADKNFDTFKKIDKQLDGKLTKAIQKRLGIETPMSELENLKTHTNLLKARKENKKAIVELRELEARSYDWLIDDAPSLAVGYTGGGKRRKRQSEGSRSYDRLWEDVPNFDSGSGKKK